VCEYVCPADAITLVDRISGHAYLSETRFGPMAHAVLKTAEEASGMLVSLVRENAKRLAREGGRDLIIIDGPPGIGCPVISAIAGVDLVLIVSEPTVSGIHDAERVIGVTKHFRIPALLLVNKFDLNLEMTEKLERFCLDNGVALAGRLPYDNVTTEAMIAGKTVVEHSDGEFAKELRRIWMKVLESLG
jgi:MinD superfamily P-loop ATPase